ncbi:two-component system response regulator [Oscillatoria acuminata]|uniref:Diguanylate cyclase (GGDEF) domain-containing protein n=1 Tax=Oscillatoria acuminata PCC 6304 TaxID=56110 RepID=K9TJP3_9CYAN|nr:GGDEF domain-containing response regulator [Oscillatoria acuminata]AFY83077.1 diguanylate cyclase (GGDEF) domain-containing protein [Oscillatoria acuminata PCC 6304]
MNTEPLQTLQKDILIVDDTQDNLRYLATILTEEGYKVRKALNGQMALKACRVVVPDLILLDIMMPDMSGYQVCEILKENEATREIPVIFLSALDDAFDKVKAFNVGGIDYISKPFQLEEVLARIQTQLLRRDAELKIQQLNAELETRVQERTLQLEESNQELVQEIKERKQLQERLLHLALHDPLTNLPNRALFMERLAQAIAFRKANPDYQFAVLFLDCDRFKVVNDSLGHLVGDELLIAIAKRLQSALRQEDTLARLGGDEFAVLVEELPTLDRAQTIADRILHSLTEPFQLSRYEVFINASIGITLSSFYHEKPEYLLRDADTAMYRAKALGKGQYYLFDPGMHDEALNRLQLENDLRRAVERLEFKVYYQPIISLTTGRIYGFEALVRWQHPTRGFISPLDFIPIAEETGLIANIDLWVLGETVRQLQAWQHQNLINDTVTCSVNLSARHFLQFSFIQHLRELLESTQINPQMIKLEITESAIANKNQATLDILHQIRDCQIELSIDDFGTGYSSLSYLEEFPVNVLKIDRSFIKRIDGQEHQCGLVPGIIGIAHTMGMIAIAEGVETPIQLEKLRGLGCDFAQGYLFSKPLDPEAIGELLARSPQW